MANSCINHPVKKAVSKCKQCGSALCADCEIKKENGIFCSVDCYQKTKEFTNKVMDYAPAPKKGGLIKKLIILIVILVILSAIAKYALGFDVIKMIKGFI